MQAFRVFYQTGGKQDSMIVLVDHDTPLEVAVANKDKDFKVDRPTSRIISHQVIPISNVLVSDLSVTELLALMKQN